MSKTLAQQPKSILACQKTKFKSHWAVIPLSTSNMPTEHEQEARASEGGEGIEQQVGGWAGPQ